MKHIDSEILPVLYQKRLDISGIYTAEYDAKVTRPEV